jgi:serine/threonine-protein kinase
LPASAPPELADICDRAMASAPGERYQTVTDLRDALTGWVRHRGSVSLARAAQERLDQLLALLRSGSKERAEIVPLLSECRFGFSQALKEWPENQLAGEGLRDCVEAAARFEVSQGNLEAARALCAELASVPKDLAASLERLATAAKERAAREARLMHLEKEMDPRVSRRQRVLFFIAMGLTTFVLVVSTRYSTTVRQAMSGLGSFYMAAVMTLDLVPYVVALWLGRKSLFATRINRRAAGVLGLAILGPLANRIAAGFTGTSIPQTLVSDMILTATMASAAALMLHYSFFMATAAFLVSAALAVVFPEYASPLHGLAAIVSVGTIGVSMRWWGNELGLSERKPRKS